MIPARHRPGYAFLVTVLLIGALASAVTASLLLLAAGTGKSALSLQQSSQALAYARTCAERAIADLRSGGAGEAQTVTLADGTCAIRPVGGVDDETRTVCVQGDVGGVTRRLEIELTALIPTVTVRSWREVAVFSLCP